MATIDEVMRYLNTIMTIITREPISTQQLYIQDSAWDMDREASSKMLRQLNSDCGYSQMINLFGLK